MRQLAAVAALLVIAALAPTPEAAAAQGCLPGAFRQDDLAGTYISPENRMRLTVFPCGGSVVLWENHFGMHEAGYRGQERVEGGGFFARLAIPDPVVRSLDGRDMIWVKPAEPGWVQIVTVSPFGDEIKVYRLRKLD